MVEALQIAVVGLADNATGYDTQSMDAAKDLRKDAKPLVKDTGLQLRMAMIVRGFVEPIARELPMEYALELNRLIELQMEGAVG